MESGLVSHIQKYSIQDGPGIRDTVFLKGCPLHCAWCHNPENVSPQREVVTIEARCVRCGQCLQVCPRKDAEGVGQAPGPPNVRQANGAPSPPANGASFARGNRTSADLAVLMSAPSLQTKLERLGLSGMDAVPAPLQASTNCEAALPCTLCGACVEACPTGARVMMGRRMTVSEVLSEILADRIFYDDSSGGVTFSGGEPLLQFDFLKELLLACRAQGVHTAIDTSGFAPRAHLLAIAPLVDLFLYDLKFMDEARHREFTGVSNQLILENLRALGQIHGAIWVRIPMIPTANDNPDELDAMAQFVATVPSVRQVNLLPYHTTGIHKFSRLGQEYRLKRIVAPSATQLEAAVARFTAFGLNAKAGG
jgi:pyruvate formate lyase activating enzyme